MPLMHLAKVNLNSKIFDVYEKKIKLIDVLNEMYENFDDKHTYEQKTKKSFTDQLGNKKDYTKTSKYNFIELKKNKQDMIITGKLVRTYNKPAEQMKNGKIIGTYSEEIISIYFYFDVRKELISFSTRQSFGYIQFINAFKNLLDKMNKKYTFEVFLKKDKSVLEEKLKSFKIVKRVSAILIPPNANQTEIEELSSATEGSYINQAKKTNAKKIKIELIDTDDVGLNMQANMMKETIDAAVKGYGDLTSFGINHNGREQVVKSNNDAALTRVIKENLEEHDYNEEASAFIAAVVAKSLLEDEEKNEKE